MVRQIYPKSVFISYACGIHVWGCVCLCESSEGSWLWVVHWWIMDMLCLPGEACHWTVILEIFLVLCLSGEKKIMVVYLQWKCKCECKKNYIYLDFFLYFPPTVWKKYQSFLHIPAYTLQYSHLTEWVQIKQSGGSFITIFTDETACLLVSWNTYCRALRHKLT